MPMTKRWHWLQQATGETKVTAVAQAVGVTHPTIQRWLKNGAPIRAVMNITVQFDCDLIEALVIWGFLDDGEVARLNYRKLAMYFPTDVLTFEAHRRASEYLAQDLPDPYRKTKVGMLRRA